MTKYDLIVIGGGPAGITAAKYAAFYGKRVAIIEKYRLGGECTWSGCVASKALLKIADVAHNAKQLKKFGLTLTAPAQISSLSVMDHARSAIDQVYQTEKPEVLQALGIDIIIGAAQFIDSTTVEVNNEQYQAKKYIIATGSKAAIPPIEGIKEVPYLTNVEFFDLNSLPSSVIIVGGGPNGIELGSALVRLGVATTIIEPSETILPHQDTEITELLRQQLEKEGMKIHTGLRAVKAIQKDNRVIIEALDKHENGFEFDAEKLVIACGRVAQVHNLALEKAGIAYSNAGIAVDDTLRTTVSHIYACGDVVGPYRFSHIAMYQAGIAARNALFPWFKKHVDYGQIIWVTFCEPEFAAIGLPEQLARQLYGNNIEILRIPYKEVDRAKTDLDEVGMAKFILTSSGYIVGASILGSRAGEVIHELQLAKYQGIKLYKLHSMLHAYPTYSELIAKAAEICYQKRQKRSLVTKFIRLLSSFRR